MLKGISPLISPDLLKVLAEMGHGDEIVLADAHFPGHSTHHRVVRADGIGVADLLEGVLPLLELDAYVETPVVMMAPVEGDHLDEKLMTSLRGLLQRFSPASLPIGHISRNDFYLRAAKAYCVVMTGETAIYGNVLLKKGVTPLGQSK